ncbi:hypothetical protein [Promicromonospora umidemergens]|nr:hypothetical protein [Promicromonospora umidemergens]
MQLTNRAFMGYLHLAVPRPVLDQCRRNPVVLQEASMLPSFSTKASNP